MRRRVPAAMASGPQSLRPSAHMPALELTDADIDLLAVYLSTLP